jgi:hypothetical protein
VIDHRNNKVDLKILVLKKGTTGDGAAAAVTTAVTKTSGMNFTSNVNWLTN